MKTRLLTFLSVFAALCACDKNNEPTNWVDLRYDVPQDTYTIDSDGVQIVTIRVKSTDPWTVFGSKNEDWYTITPNEGGPDEIFNVTITCLPNTELDDRQDTINIKSDYWTGKQFLLIQKGTAFLEFAVPDTISQSGETVGLKVLANQNWSAEITSGEEWLDIKDGSSGNGEGFMSLGATFNAGEQRSGEVTLYDRNGVSVQTITIIQKGVLLSPVLPPNGKYHVLYSEAQQLRIPIESNSRWTVSKNKPDEETWYEFADGSLHEGSKELVIDVSEYAEGSGSAVREGMVIISSESQEGVAPVVKTIRFKQASPDKNRTQTTAGEVLDSEGVRSDDGIPAGKYTFHIAPFTAADCTYLYFFWQREGTSFAELRFWLNTDFAPMKTELSCMPYCNDVNKWQNNLLVPIDNTKPVKIAIDIRESEPDASGQTWIYSEWWLNDVRIAYATSDGIVDRDGNTDNWKTKYSDTIGTGYFRIWAFKGSPKLEKWEYTSPIVWGD